MQLTAAELSKWLNEVPGNYIVTVSESGDYINVLNPVSADDGMSILVADDED